MKKVTVPAVKELLGARDAHSVSIYMRTDPRHPGGARDRSRLRALLREVSEQLAPTLGRRGVDALLVPIAERARQEWPEARSVAFLRSRGTSAAFALPTAVPDLAVVASTFHTKPLVAVLDGGDRFALLAIGGGAARLYEGTPDALARVDGVLPDRGARDRAAWYRAVDEAVRRHLADTEEPLVLAGEHDARNGFRAVSDYPWIVEEELECDLAQVQVPDLVGPAHATVKAHRADVETEAAVQYLVAAAAARATDDLAAVARAAVGGRVRLLVHRRGAHVWGRLDPITGQCVLRSGAPATGDADVIDDLGEIVLQHGGDVVELSPERMPCGAPVGAVIRRPLAVAPRRHAAERERAVSPP